MSIYAISDLHGCYEEFAALLERVSFDDKKDILYILGDIIDRGPDSGNIVKWALPRWGKSVRFIKGNHEDMLLNDASFYGYRITSSQLSNGTILSGDEMSMFIRYIESAPCIESVQTNDGKHFVLSHAGLRPPYGEEPDSAWIYQDKRDLLWIRDEWLCSDKVPPFTCVFGHTPISSILETWHGCGMASLSDIRKWDGGTLKWNNKIAIDGGCCFGYYLILLRLDDLTEFIEPCHYRR